MKTMLEGRGWSIKRKLLNHKPLTIQYQVGKRSTVGARGFEPPTSCTPCKRASRTAPRPVQVGPHYSAERKF